MTYVTHVIGSANNGSNACSLVLPAAAVLQPGHRITYFAVRGNASVSAILPESTNPAAVFTRDDAQTEAPSAIESTMTYVVHDQVATAADAGATVTFRSSSATSTGRWRAIAFIESGVPAAARPVLQRWVDGTTGTEFVIPAATPLPGAGGGTAMHVVLGVINGNASAGMTFTSPTGTLREQRAHTGTSGISPMVALLDRPFTGDSQVPAGSATSSVASIDRAAFTILWASSQTQPLAVSADTEYGEATALGGDYFRYYGAVSGGTAPYTYLWRETTGKTFPLRTPTSINTALYLPLGGGAYDVELQVTDSAGTVAVSRSLPLSVTPRYPVDLLPSTLPEGWSTSSGTTDPSAIYEKFPDPISAAYVQAPNTTVPLRQNLGPLPGGVRNSGIYLMIAASQTSGAQVGNITIDLLEGTVVRASRSVAPQSTTASALGVTFLGSDLAAIGNLANCALRISMDRTNASARIHNIALLTDTTVLPGADLPAPSDRFLWVDAAGTRYRYRWAQVFGGALVFLDGRGPDNARVRTTSPTLAPSPTLTTTPGA